MEPDGTASVRFLVLGPVEFRVGGAPVQLRANKVRALFALLVLYRNRVAATDRLIELLWNGAPPPSARATLQNYVMRLRRILAGAGATEVLRTVPLGYSLAASPGESDADVFADLASRARASLERGDPGEASQLARKALALWRGPALAGLDIDLAGDVFALEGARLATLELRVAADLALGRHDSVLPELAALLTEHPLRERLWEQYMRALYGVGRRAEALAAYQEARRHLRTELGLEPSPALRRLEAAVLDGVPVGELEEAADAAPGSPGQVAPGPSGTPPSGPPPGPAPTRTPTAPGSAPVPVPAQLPPDISDFTGRNEEVARLADSLGDFSRTSTAVWAVTGAGGVGKTALAVHTAHLLRGRYPDGQLLITLGGTTARPLPIEEILPRLLRDLGVAPSAVPAAVDEQGALYRSLSAERRMLLVLDDAHDAAQVRALLPGSPGSAVVVTSRQRLAGLAGCRRLELAVLPAQDARDLFHAVVGADRGDNEADAVADIVETCGFLPLAVRIAASRLAVRTGWRVETLRDRLADTRRRLDELNVDDLQIRTCFQLSFHTLSEDQARGFRMLSLLETPEVGLTAAAAFLGLGEAEAERLVEALVDVHLLESTAPGRYRYHDLLRLFAREAAAESDDGFDHALDRLLDDYAAATEAVTVLARPGLLSGRKEQDRFRDEAGARAWLAAELDQILAAVVQAARAGRPGVGTEILHRIQWHLRAHGLWHVWERTNRILLAAATRAQDRAAELEVRQQLGHLAVLRGWDEEAETHLVAARELARALGDRSAEAYTDNRLGLWVYTTGRITEAIDFHERARSLFAELDDPRGLCVTLINIGKCYRGLKEPRAAVGYLEDAITLARRLDDGDNLTIGLHHLACCQSELGAPAAAIDAHLAALPELRRRGYREGEAFTLAELGLARAANDELPQALESLKAAIRLFEELGDPRSGAFYLWHAGRVHERLGDATAAGAAWRQALAVIEAYDPETAGKIEAALAGLARSAGHPGVSRSRQGRSQ